MGFNNKSNKVLLQAVGLKANRIGGWGEESATGKSVSVSFRVRVVRAVRASGRGEAA